MAWGPSKCQTIEKRIRYSESAQQKATGSIHREGLCDIKCKKATLMPSTICKLQLHANFLHKHFHTFITQSPKTASVTVLNRLPRNCAPVSQWAVHGHSYLLLRALRAEVGAVPALRVQRAAQYTGRRQHRLCVDGCLLSARDVSTAS